jgi:hypothetical protein
MGKGRAAIRVGSYRLRVCGGVEHELHATARSVIHASKRARSGAWIALHTPLERSQPEEANCPSSTKPWTGYPVFHGGVQRRQGAMNVAHSTRPVHGTAGVDPSYINTLLAERQRHVDCDRCVRAVTRFGRIWNGLGPDSGIHRLTYLSTCGNFFQVKRIDFQIGFETVSQCKVYLKVYPEKR